MAAKVFGTAHLYGVSGTISNATVTDFKNKSSLKNTAETQNESGNEIERRRDDQHNEATITIKIRTGYTIPEPGSTLVYETVTWEIVDVEKVQNNRGHRLVTLNLLNSEFVTYP